MAIDLPEFNATEYDDSIRSQYLINMKALRQKFDDENHAMFLKVPRRSYSKVAEEIGAEMVVLQVLLVAQVYQLLLGNTANTLSVN